MSLYRASLVSLNSTVYFVTLMSLCLFGLNKSKTTWEEKKEKGNLKNIVIEYYLGSF